MPKRTVLLIDDEEIVRKTLSIHLTKEGYTVLQYAGGAGVFDRLATDKTYELVISDIRMPEVTGIQVLEHIKNNYPDIPVIILTGLLDINITIDAMKMGAFDFLLKPVTKEQLLKCVKNAFYTKDLIMRTKQLEQENLEYQKLLEQKVEERTKELNEKTIALEEAYEILQTNNFQTVKVLADAVEAKDKYTRGHCDRIRLTCMKLGELLGISEEEKIELEFAAILHDLGKIGIADAILNKSDALTNEEFNIIKMHPLIGEKILSEVRTLKSVSKITRHHHESYDGSGYPDGLSGSQIPFLSRILAVADVYDALTSDRPYRKAFPIDEAIHEIQNMTGIKLDPDIVQLLMTNIKNLDNPADI